MAGMGSALNFKGCTIQIDSYRRYRPAIGSNFLLCTAGRRRYDWTV